MTADSDEYNYDYDEFVPLMCLVDSIRSIDRTT